jgi:hypothetical protein
MSDFQGNPATPGERRQTGLRRASAVTVGIAGVAVAALLGFAGLARSGTQQDRSGSTGTDSSTQTTDDGTSTNSGGDDNSTPWLPPIFTGGGGGGNHASSGGS